MFPCANIFLYFARHHPPPHPHPYPYKFSNGPCLKVHLFSLGSLSNDDGDGNEDGRKATGLDWQNNNFARASRFLYISLSPLLHDYNAKVPYFTFGRGREHKTTTFFFFSWILIQSLEFNY